MGRKNRNKHRHQSAPSAPVASQKSGTSASPAKQKINAMDIFRAQDQASKAIVRARAEDGFDNFISRVGLNNDNALSDSTYELNLVSRNRLLLEAAYRGSWLVGVVIDSVAEDMTRAGIDISTNEAEEDIKDLQSAMSRLQIWQSLCSVIKWGRLYGGCLGFMQIEGQDPSTPLNLETVAKDQFKGISVYDRWMVQPSLDRTIGSGPDMGLPEYYRVITSLQMADPHITKSTFMDLHHSRVIRYTGIDLPFYQAITENWWGESNLERLWDRLIAFDNATMSSGQLIDRASLRTVSIEGLREIVAAGGDAQRGLEAQFEMMRLAQVNEGLTLLDKNDTFQSTAYSFSGLSDMMLQFGQQLSGASGIPLVRLFGQSPAGLSSTGDADIRMYYDNINAQQEAKLRRPFEVLLRVLWRSTFGDSAPKDLEFTFTALWQMSALDKANIAKTSTETILGAFEGTLIDRATAMKELRASSGDTGLFSNISDEDVEEAESEDPPMPDGPPAPGEVKSLSEAKGKGEPPAAEKEESKEKPPGDVVKNLDQAEAIEVTAFKNHQAIFGKPTLVQVRDARPKTHWWEKVMRWLSAA